MDARICVAWNKDEGDAYGMRGSTRWCRAKSKKTLEYKDRVRTACGMYVICPIGLERREPTCPDCKRKERT